MILGNYQIVLHGFNFTSFFFYLNVKTFFITGTTYLKVRVTKTRTKYTIQSIEGNYNARR